MLITWHAVLLTVVLLWGLRSWSGSHPQRGQSSAQPLDLIVVIDGGSSRLAAAERIRHRIMHGDPQRGSRYAPDLLLIRCSRSSPLWQPMQELLQGYYTATQNIALVYWLQQRLVPPPRRVWISTDPEHTARAGLLAASPWLADAFISNRIPRLLPAPAAGWCLRPLPANGRSMVCRAACRAGPGAAMGSWLCRG